MEKYALDFWNGRRWQQVDEGSKEYIDKRMKERTDVFHDPQNYRIRPIRLR